MLPALLAAAKADEDDAASTPSRMRSAISSSYPTGSASGAHAGVDLEGVEILPAVEGDQTSSVSKSSTVSRLRMAVASPSRTRIAAGRGTPL